MKIARIEATWVSIPIAEERQHRSDFGQIRTFDAAIVRVDTDTGITGWGEGKNAAGSAGTYAGLVTLINREFAPRLLGRDPRDISVIWDALYNGVRAHHAAARGHAMPDMARRGLTIAAISAIDIALWDIAGKSMNVPVWRLLGGRKADKMPAYASGGWADARTIGDELKGYVAQGGFRAVKMRIGAMDGTPQASAERVKAARAALGPDVEIMVDSHGTFTVAEARRFAHLVRDCDLAWFEEPVTADDKAGMAEVRASSMIPIAAGESEFTRFDFRDLIIQRAVDIMQPDLAICGGITEARRIDALAAAFNLRLAPHLWAGAPAFFAGLHLAAASSSSHILEYSLGANPMLHDLVEEEVGAKGGLIAIPDRPGLGITVREDVVARHAVPVQ
ncbi:MAG: mandelate racemase/muconate lactonizing enzyme family protein [Parvibaculaceae bacterium]